MVIADIGSSDGSKESAIPTKPKDERVSDRGLKRGAPVVEPTGRKERQARYTKKTRNAGVFERFVRDSVGLDSITSGLRTKTMRVFEERGFVASCKILAEDYDRGKEKILEATYATTAFDGIGKIGFGVASPVLLTNLLSDLRGKTPPGLNACPFRNIPAAPGRSTTDKAKYAFFHWDKNSGGITVETDYRKRDYFLSKRTVREIDALGFGICRFLFPNKFNALDDDQMKGHILLLPALVKTEKAHHQRLHLNGEPGEILFLLHFPLCKEGMLLRVSENSSPEWKNRDYIRIPFGSYAITRGDVYHAGIYGDSGNFHFHMVVKTVDKGVPPDRLKLLEKTGVPEDCNSWKPHMYDDAVCIKSYSTRYMEMLKEKCGSVFEEDWTEVLDT